MKRTWPYGKHKGQALDTIPRGYLRWALDNVRMDERLRTAVQLVVAKQPLPDEPEEIDVDARVHEIVQPVDIPARLR